MHKKALLALMCCLTLVASAKAKDAAEQEVISPSYFEMSEEYQDSVKEKYQDHVEQQRAEEERRRKEAEEAAQRGSRPKTAPVSMLYSTSTKTYMDYRAITNTSSAQYRLIHSDQIEICDDGFLRAGEYIGVAMGSYFGEIGNKFIIILDNGNQIPVIKVEAKSDRHTTNGFIGTANQDIIEFVIDTSAGWMRQNVYQNGYIFGGNFNNYDQFNGRIVQILQVIE